MVCFGFKLLVTCFQIYPPWLIWIPFHRAWLFLFSIVIKKMAFSSVFFFLILLNVLKQNLVSFNVLLYCLILWLHIYFASVAHCLSLYFWQTYVLDVHPFNPRIAMSAGYDGKTIVWDVRYCSQSFSILIYCFASFCSLRTLVYYVSRYGRAYLSGHMKLDALSWLMENFLRKWTIKCIL